MFDTPGSQHLEAARLKVWPDATWKPFQDDMPVRHLDVLSDDGEKLRIFDCTHKSIDDETIQFLRSVIRKSTRKKITCCVIAENKSATDQALMDAVYAIYPLFMFAKFLKGEKNSLEIASTLEDYVLRRSAANYFALLKSDAFEFWWPNAFKGHQYAEYMRANCQACGKDMFAATGVIPLWADSGSHPDIYEEIRVHRQGIHLRLLTDCHDLLAESALDELNKTKSFGDLPATPVRSVHTDQAGTQGYQACCPSCGAAFEVRSFVETVRDPFIRRASGGLSERLKYVQVLENGINWDYDYVEAYKFDDALYRAAGTPAPSWTLKDASSV